jgi:hypothetical protein
MTPPQAQKIIEAIKKEGATEKLVATANSIALEVPGWLMELSRRNRELSAKIDAMHEIITNAGAPPVQAAAGAPVFDTGTTVPPSAQRPASRRGQPRVNADGTPMSAADQAIEDAMDTATEGQSPNEGMSPGSVPTPAAAPRPTAVAPKPVAPKPKMTSVPVNGNGGTATDAKV